MPSISSTAKSRGRADAEMTDDMPPLDRLIPVGDVCERLGVCRSTGRQWIRSQTTPLRAVRAGNGWFTTEAWVADWLKRRTAAFEQDRRAGSRADRPAR